MKKLNFALFGMGRMGRIHANNLFLLKGVHLKYIVEQNQQVAQEYAKKFYCSVATPTEVFNDETINSIVITTPTQSHAQIILQACSYKKNIFCEKPIASSLQQAKTIAQEVEQSGIIFLTAFNRRFDPSFQKLKTELQAGKIGKLLHLLIISRDSELPPASYVANSGGLVLDMMIHDLDMALWILDEQVTQISAIGSNFFSEQIKNLGDIDSACVTLQTASGKIAQIINSRYSSYGYDQRIEAFGEKGKLLVGNQKTTELQLATNKGFHTDKTKLFFLERYQKAYYLEMQHFYDCVHKNKQPLISAQDGLQTLELAARVMKKIPQIKI